jgi:Ulp1 family protease
VCCCCIQADAASCIAVLDPLGSYHRKKAIVLNLRTFLRMEWENSQGRSSDEDVEVVSEYETERVLAVNAKAPMQENSYDCGVYVLTFAEVMLQNCLELGLLTRNDGVIGKDVTDGHFEALITSSAFSAEDITATRKQLQKFIVADSNAYQEVKKEKAKAAET